MKRLTSVFFATVLLTASIFMASAKPAGAQGSNGYVVSPVREELTIEKGNSQVVSLRIDNATQIPTTARAVVNDFEASQDESGQPRMLLDDSQTASGNSFKSLVSDIPDITLGALEKKEVSVTISVPSDAMSGGYYGAIRFIDASQANDKNVALAASVGTIFLVQVPGDIKESLQLVEFTAAKNGSTGRLFINSGEMTIITRLKNDGNIHVKPFGKVTITDRSGKVIETYEFNDVEPRSNILPNSTRKFEDKLKNQKWIGQYTITANLGYGTSGGLITAKNTFWVIPTWVLIAFIAILAAIIIGAYYVYRRFTKSRKSRKNIRR